MSDSLSSNEVFEPIFPSSSDQFTVADGKVTTAPSSLVFGIILT